MNSAPRSSSLAYVAAAFAAVAALGAVACSGAGPTNTHAALFSDSTATLDVAASTGDAMSVAVETMAAIEAAAGFDLLKSSGVSFSSGTTSPTNALGTTTTKTCFDATGAVVNGCTPLSTVRKIVTHVVTSGTRTGGKAVPGGTSATWTGAVHRVSNDTTTRNFSLATPPVELSRTHNDVSVAHDTTTFVEGTTTRTGIEAAHDSVKGVTWKLPRSSNPFPVSGSIVRADSVHVVIVKAAQTETRDIVRTVEVDFPADAQGNVVLKINAKTCSLNLVTHAVAGCK